MTKHRSLVPLVLMVVLGACAPDPDTWIEEIEASPERFWNTTVVLEGRVVEAVPEPQGTREGYYHLVDESTPQGLMVRSDELPSPGEDVTVSGLIQQEPGETGRTILRENSRYANHDPRLMWTGGAATLLGAVLLGILILSLVRSGTTRSRRRPGFAGGGPWAGGGGDRPEPEWAMATAQGSGGEAATATADRTRTFDDATKTFDLYGFLKVRSGPDAPAEFPLGGTPVLIGRAGGRQNQVELSDETVSREQARLLKDRENGRVLLINESATNRTKVNGSEVDSVELSPGDEVRMGATVMEFRQSQ